jgi:hypothetical protein
MQWVLKDSAGLELPPPAKKKIDLESRLIKDGVRKAIQDRQTALQDLVHAICHFRKGFGKQTVDPPGFGLRALVSGHRRGRCS